MRAKEFITEMPFVSDLPKNKGFASTDIGFDAEKDEGYTDEHIAKFANMIRRDCAPFIKNNRVSLMTGEYLYRGIKGADPLNDFVITGTVRQDRRPRDTDPFWHDLLNNYFQKEFGFPYRSAAMFASTDVSSTTDYGPPYVVFPVGEYSMLFSGIVSDLTIDLTQDPDGHAQRNVLRKISDNQAAAVGQQYGLPFQNRGDVMGQEGFAKFMRGLVAGRFRNTDEFGFDQKFLKFLKGFFLPRLQYEETYQIADLGHSEAMIKCQSYYGIQFKDSYRSNGAAHKLMTMILE